jgi:hypothetical protein
MQEKFKQYEVYYFTKTEVVPGNMETNYGEACLIEESSVSGPLIKNHPQDILIPFPAHSAPASVKHKVLTLVGI